MHSDSDIPRIEPTEIIAGVTNKWTREDLTSHYPATAWTLTYYFVGPTLFTKAATADGSNFDVTLSATETSVLLPGRYTLYGRVAHTSNGELYEVYKADLVVIEDPASIVAAKDQRSWARITRDNLRAAIQGSSDSFILNYSVGGAGRTIGKMTAEDRIKWLQFFEAKVVQEEQKASGKSRDILIQFSKR